MISIDTFKRGLRRGFDVLILLGKIMLPIYVVVELLKYSGLLETISRLFIPFMSLLGLPGEAAFALIIGAAVNTYAALGVLVAMTLTAKQATIIAVVLSIAHNLIGETVVIRRIGVNPYFITGLRIVAAFSVGTILNLVL
ncbi:MAG: nucleoside recognition domain-containing protein [Eubacteriales bacterium]|nr:nucleoside recognition domain-containing protein [Eubacteriales bacterium]